MRLFQPKVKGNKIAEAIIKKLSGCESKAFIIEEIYAVTGVRVHKATIYSEQKRLNLI